jgi:hypothetical protein
MFRESHSRSDTLKNNNANASSALERCKAALVPQNCIIYFPLHACIVQSLGMKLIFLLA